jgi:hypothetical protein
MLITSSGADVPKATTVNPITMSVTPSFRAKAAAPSVKAVAPTSISSKPTIKYSKLSSIYAVNPNYNYKINKKRFYSQIYFATILSTFCSHSLTYKGKMVEIYNILDHFAFYIIT